MFRTLGCLAGAMTGTTALLAWMDPSPPIPMETLPFDEVLRLAHSVVADDVVIRRDKWRNIEILAGPVSGDSPPFLTAVAGPAKYDFLVDFEGRPSRTARWTQRQLSADRRHTVTIQVARWQEHQLMTRAQWRCVRALTAALQEVIVPQGTPLPVYLHEEWARIYGDEAGMLLDLSPSDPAAR